MINDFYEGTFLSLKVKTAQHWFSYF